MAQADEQNTARDVLMKRHFALGEEEEHQLRQLACVVSGLKSLAHDGRADTAREAIEIAREDMAAIFDLIAERIDALTADMPFVTAH